VKIGECCQESRPLARLRSLLPMVGTSAPIIKGVPHYGKGMPLFSLVGTRACCPSAPPKLTRSSPNLHNKIRHTAKSGRRHDRHCTGLRCRNPPLCVAMMCCSEATPEVRKCSQVSQFHWHYSRVNISLLQLVVQIIDEERPSCLGKKLDITVDCNSPGTSPL
jgi:hypothetical protein